MLIALVVQAAGCQAPPPQPPPVVIRLPPLEAGDGTRSIASMPEASSALPSPTRPAPQRLIVRTVAFDRDSPRLAAALDVLAEVEPDGADLRLWRENGLILASVERFRLPLLMANLPKPVAGRVFTLYNAQIDTPVTLIDGVTGRQRVEVVESDGSVHPRRFFGGEFRLLIRILPPEADDRGPLRLALLPQHFSPARRLLIPGPQDLSRQGHAFHQLHLHRPISEDEVWVIAADPDAPTDRPLDDEGPRPRSAPQPVPLGQAMLSGEHRGRPVSLVVFIALEESSHKP